MLIKYYLYKTNINFIYPTEDTVTNKGIRDAPIDRPKIGIGR